MVPRTSVGLEIPRSTLAADLGQIDRRDQRIATVGVDDVPARFSSPTQRERQNRGGVQYRAAHTASSAAASRRRSAYQLEASSPRLTPSGHVTPIAEAQHFAGDLPPALELLLVVRASVSRTTMRSSSFVHRMLTMRRPARRSSALRKAAGITTRPPGPITTRACSSSSPRP